MSKASISPGNATRCVTPIVVWGAGAIGGTIGAHLVRADRSVVFVDVVAEHVRRIAAGTLTIDGPVINFTVGAPAFAPAQFTGVYELFLLAVKSQHTEQAARMIARHLAANGAVVSFQNGLNELVISDVIGRERTIGAALNLPADWIGPGHITYGELASFTIGELDGRHSRRIEDLATILHDVTPHVKISDDIVGDIWGKMAFASLLTASALTNELTRDFVADPALRPLIVGLVREVLMVAQLEQHPARAFQWFQPEAFLRNDTEGIANQLAAFSRSGQTSTKLRSGIWRDLAVRKRPTEVPAQFAILQTAARRHDFAIPLNDHLVTMIIDIEAGRRRIGMDLAFELLAVAAAPSPALDKSPTDMGA
jgi:2-dehydropantoate 2-reductase